MSITYEQSESVRIELDELIACANRQIDANSSNEVALDCSSVTVIRSSMLDGLIRLNRRAKRCEVHMVLVNVNELVFETLKLTRLDRVLHLRYDENHARVAQHHLAALKRRIEGSSR